MFNRWAELRLSKDQPRFVPDLRGIHVELRKRKFKLAPRRRWPRTLGPSCQQIYYRDISKYIAQLTLRGIIIGKLTKDAILIRI
jgi:hypothetical protein